MKKILGIILIIILFTNINAQNKRWIDANGTARKDWRIGLQGGAIKWTNDSLLYKVLWNNNADSAYFVLTDNTNKQDWQLIKGKKMFKNIFADTLRVYKRLNIPYIHKDSLTYHLEFPGDIAHSGSHYDGTFIVWNNGGTLDTLASREYVRARIDSIHIATGGIDTTKLAYINKNNIFTAINSFSSTGKFILPNSSSSLIYEGGVRYSSNEFYGKDYSGEVNFALRNRANTFINSNTFTSYIYANYLNMPTQTANKIAIFDASKNLISGSVNENNIVLDNTIQSITGTKTFTRLMFSGTGVFNLPTSDMGYNTSMWLEGNIVKYRNSSGTAYSLATLSDLNNYISKPTNARGMLKNDGTGIIYWQALLATEISDALGYTPTYIYDSGVSTSYTWSASKINTELSYKPSLSNNNTWTGSNTFNSGVSFGTNGYFVVPSGSAALQGALFKSGATANLYFYRNTYGYERVLLESDLNSLVATSRTLTINNTTYDLSSNRTWTVGDARLSNNNTWTGSNTFNQIDFGSNGYIKIGTYASGLRGSLFINGATSKLYMYRNDVGYYDAFVFENDLGNYFHKYNSNTITGDNTFTGLTTFNKSVGTSTDLLSSAITKNSSGADAVVKAGKFVASVTVNDNTTAYGLYSTASGGTTNYSGYFDNGILSTNNIVYRSNMTDTTGTGISINVKEKTFIKWNGTNNTTISALINGVDGQQVIITNINIDYTLTLNESGNIVLSGTSFTLGLYDTITLIYNSTYNKWLEISRSDN